MRIDYKNMDYGCEFMDVEPGAFFFIQENGLNGGFIKVLKSSNQTRNLAVDVSTGELITFEDPSIFCYEIPTAKIVNEI